MGRIKCKMISLDTSTTKSGWAYYENGLLANSGIIDLSKEKDSLIRVEDMIMNLYALLNKYKPDIVVIETPPYIKDAKCLINLAEITGAVRGWATDKAEFIEYMPQQWRSLIKSDDDVLPRKRSDCKAWDLYKVRTVFGIENIGDDEADAILIGLARINHLSQTAIEKVS